MTQWVHVNPVKQSGIMAPGAFRCIRRLNCGDPRYGGFACFGDDHVQMLEILPVVLIKRQAKPFYTISQSPGVHRGGDEVIDFTKIPVLRFS